MIRTLLLASCLLSGCASQTPHFDAGFGGEVRTLVAQQMRDPDASVKNRDRSIDGLDGRASKQTMDTYIKSFSVPPKPTNVLSIGLGGSDGGSGAAR